MGAGCRAIFTPASIRMLRSRNIERTNDAFVDQRRSWTPSHVLAEYERWSRRLIWLAGAVSRTPVTRIRMPLAELGTFPVGLVLGGAMTFDQHTHLRHDIAPALGMPAPATDEDRMAVVLEWMFAVLSNQLEAESPAWFDRPVAITLNGPGGGSWLIRAGGAVIARCGPSAAHIVGAAIEFPVWATKRIDWHDQYIEIKGDGDYGAMFLDAVNVV